MSDTAVLEFDVDKMIADVDALSGSDQRVSFGDMVTVICVQQIPVDRHKELRTAIRNAEKRVGGLTITERDKVAKHLPGY